ncbi:GDP-perosamine synthase [Algimonas arctica]|uniref:GDP-perosamine synthase n=2 Tax=Algimonas arctica TaxID=1479486 RepID=A0A8J3G1D7_9PROT|nr:GDP-perosamine synthase [Algimonas arctica]
MRILFVTNSKKKLVGVLTDGDVRRGLIAGFTLEEKISNVMNKNFVSYNDTMKDNVLKQSLSDRISVIPLVNDDGEVTRFVFNSDPTFIPAAQPSLKGNELAYTLDCIKSGWISSQGAYVGAFEKAFEQKTGTLNAVSVSNGTVALVLALSALGVGPGDEVIVPDLTFAASLNAVIHVGATPVIVDIELPSLSMDPKAVAAAITNQTKAIMPVHLYGQMCEMDELVRIAKENGILIVEDAAEALGSEYKGRHAGTIGDAGTFSFFANKLITTGEGGMVVFKDPEVAKRARILRDHGMDPAMRYWHLEVGHNFRMTNIQAAIGLAQLERFDELLGAKLAIAKHYTERLSDLSDDFLLPSARPSTLHSFWNYVVLLRDPDSLVRGSRLIDFMNSNRIEARRLFFPMHIMPPYQHLSFSGSYDNSISASNRGFALPCYIGLSEQEIDDICSILRKGVDMLDVERWARV